LSGIEKMRILVDKVMQPQAGWVAEEWMIEETARAGFNVYSPRMGYDRPDEVKAVAEWCAKNDMLHMPWMGGSLPAPDDTSAKGNKLLWSSGVEQDLWSPNSDEFWRWMEKHIVSHARISADCPSLMGVFLDFENYAPGAPPKGKVCYPLSYDDHILNMFAEHQGITSPDLPLDGRMDWLRGQNLHREFEDYQMDYWRQQCREIRNAVDEHNPGFRFCVYPAPGTLFITKACYPEWSSRDVPLLLADPASYGWASGPTSQEWALGFNQGKLVERMKVPEQAGITFKYLGGIDPVVFGATPEFCGRNAAGISDVCDGYWVFYEGPDYKVDHKHYFSWFRRANNAIANLRW